jgi:hypothetical protein
LSKSILQLNRFIYNFSNIANNPTDKISDRTNLRVIALYQSNLQAIALYQFNLQAIALYQSKLQAITLAQGII